MVYQGTLTSEMIVVNSVEEPNEAHYIELTKSAIEPVFYVTCCCYEDWSYAFYMNNNSDYERVKFNIMEAIFACETMDDLIETLNNIFKDGFKDILVGAKSECDGDCEHCKKHDEYLN